VVILAIVVVVMIKFPLVRQRVFPFRNRNSALSKGKV
jgi:hypothetical protein